MIDNNYYLGASRVAIPEITSLNLYGTKATGLYIGPNCGSILSPISLILSFSLSLLPSLFLVINMFDKKVNVTIQGVYGGNGGVVYEPTNALGQYLTFGGEAVGLITLSGVLSANARGFILSFLFFVKFLFYIFYLFLFIFIYVFIYFLIDSI